MFKVNNRNTRTRCEILHERFRKKKILANSVFSENFKVFKMWKGGNYVRSNIGYQRVNIKLIYIKRQIHSPETNNFKRIWTVLYTVLRRANISRALFSNSFVKSKLFIHSSPRSLTVDIKNPFFIVVKSPLLLLLLWKILNWIQWGAVWSYFGVINYYCVKSVRTWSFSSSYFSVFGLNEETYSLNLCN